MRILEVVEYVNYPTEPGYNSAITGYGLMVGEIARSLSERDHKVHLFSLKNISRSRRINRVHLIGRNHLFLLSPLNWLGCLRGLKSIIHNRDELKFLVRYIYFSVLSLHFKNKILRKKFDVIHVHGVTPYTVPIILQGLRQEENVIVSLHGLNSFDDSLNIRKVYKRLERLIIEMAVEGKIIVTCISTGIRERILHEYNLSSSHCNFSVITNGTELTKPKTRVLTKYDSDRERTIITCIGNISERKNQIKFFEIFKYFSNEIKSTIIVYFIGNDLYPGGFENEIERFNVPSETYKFCGFLKKIEIDEILERAKLNIVFSKVEGFGLSIIEAFSHGVPTLAYEDIDAVKDVYCSDAMLLLQARDNASTAVGIERALRRNWNKNKIQEFSRKFSLQGMAKEYEELFKQRTVEK